MSDNITVTPVMATCMYCATGYHDVCVPLVRSLAGEVRMVCECNQREHADRSD